jgi:hypothetical protein
MIAPTYVSENSPRAIRGLLIGFYQLFETMGAMVAFFIDYGSLLHVKVRRRDVSAVCLLFFAHPCLGTRFVDGASCHAISSTGSHLHQHLVLPGIASMARRERQLG